MRLILHVGMHKTGSTSFQTALRAAAGPLRAAGWGIAINPPALMVRNPNTFSPSWLPSVLELGARRGLRAVLISAEAISTFSAEQMRRAFGDVAAREIKVVVCFRHWTGFLPSRWKQNCVRRDAQDFPSYLASLEREGERHVDLAFERVIEHVAGLGNAELAVVSYDNAVLEGNLLARLAAACDLPESLVARLAQHAERHNRSTKELFYDACRLFNAVRADLTGDPPNALFESILQHGPVPRHYDHGRWVAQFLHSGGKSARELVAALRRTQVEVRLRASDYADRLRTLEVACRPWLFNPLGGRLFASVNDRIARCSTLSADGLPSSSRAEIERLLSVHLTH
ncbi:MAG: hypothetical protein KatS3mg124_0471 [Porticoccaceae bacterium]|nr:MAG: hypothetical protein KatS3mg124_0471 [Porticoccaceae bacterium]